MVQSLLKSFVLFSTLALSVVLAAPAHHNAGGITEPLARGVSRREDLPPSHPWAAGLTGPLSIVAGKRSEERRNIAEKRVTNAMRLANGLPPLAPRKLYNGSKAGSAHKPRGSATPVNGVAILVYDSNGRSGKLLGYVSRGLNTFGDYFFTSDCSTAMINPQFYLGSLTNPAKPKGYSNVGFAALAGADFSPSSFTNAFMGGTATTPAGSPPVMSTQHSDNDTYNNYIESNVWSLGENNELIPTWINSDGNTAHTEIGYVPGALNSIVITGSLAAFRTAYSDSAGTVQIRFFLADQFTCVV